MNFIKNMKISYMLVSLYTKYSRIQFGLKLKMVLKIFKTTFCQKFKYPALIYSTSETRNVFTIPFSVTGMAARLIKKSPFSAKPF